MLNLTFPFRASCALQPSRLRLAASFIKMDEAVVQQLYAVSYDALQSLT